MENQTNIQYEHGLKHSYMLIQESKMDEGNYEWKMLLHTQIPGVLPVSILSQNGKDMLQYDIDNTESLEKRYEKQSMPYEEIARLMECLDSLLNRLEEYLLPEDLLLLEPGTIFFDFSRREYCFSLLPGQERKFSQSLSLLFAWILEKIDYASDRSIILAFTLYHESCKEFFKMEELMRIVQHNLRKEKSGHPAAGNRPDKQAEAAPASLQDAEAKKDNGIVCVTEDGVFRMAAAPDLAEARSNLSDPSSASPWKPAAPETQDDAAKEEDGLIHNSADDARHPELLRFPALGSSNDAAFDPEDYAQELRADPVPPASKKLLDFLPIGKKAVGNEAKVPDLQNTGSQVSAPSLKMPLFSGDQDGQAGQKAFRQKLLLGILAMILIPVAIWFLKGAEGFRKLWMVIAILEFGVMVILALDYLMAKMPED